MPSEGVLRRLSVPLHEAGECRDALHHITGSKILANSDSYLCGGVAQGVACYVSSLCRGAGQRRAAGSCRGGVNTSL